MGWGVSSFHGRLKLLIQPQSQPSQGDEKSTDPNEKRT